MNLRIASLVALASVACDVEEPAGSQLPPPGNTPEFVVSNALPGGDIRLTWGLLEPGARVRMYVSSAGQGAGPCPAVLAGGCFDILAPRQIGQLRADADGVAELNLTLPASVPPGRYSFQAVAVDSAGFRISNVFERFTGPGICPFIFDPVCDVRGNTWDNECIAHSIGFPVDVWGFCP